MMETTWPFGILAFDLSALGSDGAVDIADVFLRTDDFELHDGFEDDRLGALGGILESLAGGDLIGDLGRVDVVVRTEGQFTGDVDHLVAGDDAAIHGFMDAFLDGRDEFIGDDAAFDGVDEFEIVVALDILRDLLAFDQAASSAARSDGRGRTGLCRRSA